MCCRAGDDQANFSMKGVSIVLEKLVRLWAKVTFMVILGLSVNVQFWS
jgi:hypothetical protein